MSNLIDSDGEKAIIAAIKAAELNTSGEIRVHIESKCATDVLEQAAKVFNQLNMHQTDLRNGILIYLATKDKKFAIIGDKGINEKVPENFWNTTKDLMQGFFRKGDFATGLTQGITMAGEQLQKYFPLTQNDKNELSNDVSFGV